ncbi:MAG: HlyD family secretion protein [Flavobacteriaceae bacterium]|nr:HlyD family secretion protein [Flavobacteriaceae bacterium]
MNDLNNMELRSEAVQEVLSRPPHGLVRWGITWICAVLVLILLVSWLVKYPEFIPAQVVITTQNPPEKIQARTDGRLVKIWVTNHQNVKKGAYLACIESSADYQDVIRLKTILDTLKINHVLFRFPVELTKNLALGEIQLDYISFEKAYTDYVLYKDLQPYSVETLASEKTSAEYRNRWKFLQNQKKLESAKYKLAQKDYERNQQLYNQGVISQVELEQKKIAMFQAQQNYQNIDLSLSQTQEGLAASQKSLQGTDINKHRDDTTLLQNALQALEQLRKTLNQWMQTCILSASINGKISFQEFWGENQFVKQGDVVMSLFPDDSKNLIGKTIVPSQNSGKIKAGQKVLIKLDNFRFQEYGIVIGKVKNISLTPDDKGNYYVEVSLPNELKTTYNKILPFDKEMRGSAEIVTEDLRLMERIFYQFRQIFYSYE